MNSETLIPHPVVVEDVRIDTAYDPDGRLRCFVLVDKSGGETRYFGGKGLD